jgi:UDP-glucose 4-epimerase
MNQVRILVTGASGFIGSKVAETLSIKLPDAVITGTGRSKSAFSPAGLPNYKYIECDLMDSGLQKKLPDEIDVVIHLAGDRRTFVKPDELSMQAASNILMTSNVADYAVSAKVKLFLYSSSVYVYSSNKAIPFREESLTIPGENLGATKLASEALLKARAVSGQFRVASFRMSTVYGPRSGDTQFIPQAIMKLKSSEPVAKFGAGDVKRDFVFVDDVANAFAAAVTVLLEKDFNYEALNVGAGKAVSIRDVVKVLAEELGTEKKIEFSIPAGTRNKADTDHQLDLTRIRSVLGWQPEYSLMDGLRQTITSLS